MRQLIERPTARAARWALRLSWFALVLFVVAGLGHRLGLVETLAFLWLLALVGLLAFGGLVLAAAGLHRLWEFGERAGSRSLAAAVLAVLALAPYGVSLWQFATLPALIDVSTDTIDPPGLNAATRAGEPFANAVNAISPADAETMIARYPTATGRRYDAPSERVVEAVLSLARARGWRLDDDDFNPLAGGDLTITGAARSLILGFPVDIAIRVTDEGETRYVDMRSASLYGRHDLGDNAARIVSFLTDLDGSVAAGVGGEPPVQPGE